MFDFLSWARYCRHCGRGADLHRPQRYAGRDPSITTPQEDFASMAGEFQGHDGRSDQEAELGMRFAIHHQRIARRLNSEKQPCSGHRPRQTVRSAFIRSVPHNPIRPGMSPLGHAAGRTTVPWANPIDIAGPTAPAIIPPGAGRRRRSSRFRATRLRSPRAAGLRKPRPASRRISAGTALHYEQAEAGRPNGAGRCGPDQRQADATARAPRRAAQAADVVDRRVRDRLPGLLLFFQPHLLLPGRAAGHRAARAGRAGSASDLYAALRGVLHPHQGGVLRRCVHRLSGDRQPDLACSSRPACIAARSARCCRSCSPRRCCSCSAPRWRTISCSRSPGGSSPASNRRPAAAACRSSCCRACPNTSTW